MSGATDRHYPGGTTYNSTYINFLQITVITDDSKFVHYESYIFF